jgi:dCMP deaminase
MTRPGWHEYFLEIAHVVAKRGTCDRRKVGSVIVDNQNRLVASGYNGAPKGMPHCDDVGHELKEIEGRQSCVRTLHAESNAIDDAGSRAQGCKIYVTVTPCYPCAQRIVQAGIRCVVYSEWYESQNTKLVQEFFRKADVLFRQVEFKSNG